MARTVVTRTTARELAGRGIAIDPASVVADRDATDGTLICAPADWPRHFDDDVEAVCGLCGVRIVHRPHAPPGLRKACIPCFARELAHG